MAPLTLQLDVRIVKLRVYRDTLQLLQLECEFARARLEHTLLRAHAAVMVRHLILHIALELRQFSLVLIL